ncbi:MAG: type IV pilus twitching motility protein PilT, partial [Sandaracinaceae bacterium]
QLDLGYEIPEVGRFRISVCRQYEGLSAVFRYIPHAIPELSTLNLPSAVSNLTEHANGLVLVTGPTGSGKSTTLASLIDKINSTSERHIITIEDPIEFVHVPKKGLVTQREVGSHVSSFAAGLRSALREAPDVLVVGEMRDFDTVHLALAAAEAGVLVFGTLHTGSAAKAIDRILGTCPADLQEQVREVLAMLLRGAVSQRLCRLAGGQGRVIAIEVLLQSISISHLIREDKIHQIESYLSGGGEGGSGMTSLERSLSRLVAESRVEEEEALRHANDPDALRAMFEKARAAAL